MVTLRTGEPQKDVMMAISRPGGRVDFEAAPGGGTLFFLELPYLVEPASQGSLDSGG